LRNKYWICKHRPVSSAEGSEAIEEKDYPSENHVSHLLPERTSIARKLSIFIPRTRRISPAYMETPIMKEVTISAATHMGPSGSRYVDVNTMPWNETVPWIRMKVLYKDNETKETAMLFETRPGAVIPEHIHGGVEWAFVLEGTMEDDEGVVSAGNFVYRPTGSRHSVRTPNGAKYIGLFHDSARLLATGALFPNYDE
jgi:quercetin dioxygenase-like cupin family protein